VVTISPVVDGVVVVTGDVFVHPTRKKSHPTKRKGSSFFIVFLLRV
jgi:hypothetical protein